MRRFYGAHARRPHEPPDESAINTGMVFDFEGVEFRDGFVVVKWQHLSPSGSLWEFYSSFASFQERIIVTYWLDPEPESPAEPSPGA
jgi:hypothetical protein